MILTLSIVFFVFGLIIGSFLNVVIFRLNTGKSFGGRSRCMHCQKTLKWYELVPVFSFLFLRGRCRECRGRISAQYPLVELATGLIFTGLFLKFQDIFLLNTIEFSAVFAFYAVIFSLLIVIAIYDIRHKIISETLVWIFNVFALAGIFLWGNPGLWELLSGPIFALPFALLWLLSKGRWMGLGDGKLMLGVGWLLGISGTLSALLIGFWSGAVIGLLLIALRKVKGIKSEIPLAPFLILGTILVFFFGFNFYAFTF